MTVLPLRKFIRVPVFVLLAASLLGLVRAQQPTTKTVKLLTIGNSFSGNATSHLGKLAEAAGHKLVHRPMSVGGASLELHWNKIAAHDKDAKDAAGLYGMKNLREELRAEPWDFITIQQASIKSHDLATYQPFAKQLREAIAKEAPKSQLLLHQTWAYRVDDPRFKKEKSAEGEPRTRQEMYEQLTKAYDAVAKELGLKVIPVGDAFNLADSDAEWGYKPDAKFDFKNAERPALPNQTHSLHTGWTWGKDKLGMDGHHASTAGQYLAAAVWLEMLFGENPVGNSYIPKDLDPKYARFLQETAHKAVTERKKR